MRLLLKHVANNPKKVIRVLDPTEDEQILFVTMCALNFVSLDHGSGVHLWNIRIKNILAGLPVWY